MSPQEPNRQGSSITPKRPLRQNFTADVLHRARIAERRASQKQQPYVKLKELFSMKIFTFMRTIPGAALGIVAISASSVGVYALANWFGGDVTVTSQSDSSVLSVDLSSCKGSLPPGVEPTDDRKNIQFKITGTPHISAQDLQQDLLGQCESAAVVDFYKPKFPEADFHRGDDFDIHDTAKTASYKYLLLPATVRSISGTSITLSIPTAKGSLYDETVPIASDIAVYNQGQPGALADVQAGDTIEFVAYSAGTTTTPIEGTSIFDASDVQILSIFKTKYNDAPVMYGTENVEPLDSYNAPKYQ